jgi:peptide/nickel transport system substrate-binding protein
VSRILARVAVAAALVLGAGVAGCGGDGSGDSTAADADTGAATSTPAAPTGSPASGTKVTRGGTLTFARTLDAEAGLNPIDAANNGSIFTIQQVFDQLVEVRGSQLVPGLAKSWEHSPDGLDWTFHLRDARFSNGDRVTAEDVKFSIDRFADPQTNVNYATLGAAIDEVDVVDGRTVKVALSTVDGAFLDAMAMFAAAIVPEEVVEEVGDERFAEHPVGSGPFKVTEFERGRRTVLKRNPYYWRKGQPYLDGVVFRYVPHASTRTRALRSGEVDVADGIPYEDVEALEQAGGISVEIADSLKWDAVFLNTTHPPLDDVRVRRALNYATPKEQIRDVILFGNARVANSNIPPVKYWDDRIRPYRYDLKMAQDLISRSSVPDGFHLRLEIPAGDEVERMTARVLRQEWGRIGVDVEVAPRDFGTMFTAWLDGKGGEAATFPGDALSSDTLSDDEIAALVYDADSGLSALGTFYERPRVLDLLADAKGTLDEDRRARDFAAVQRIALDDAPSVPLFFTESVTGYRDQVQDFETYPIGWWPLRQVWLAR